MFGISGGALKLCDLHGVDAKQLVKNKRTTNLVGIDDTLLVLEERQTIRGRGPRRLPLFCPIPDRIREYQWECVREASGNSGFIVAPCGSGKTLMGLLLAALNGGRFMVVTTRYAEQWRLTLRDFFTSFGKVTIVMYDKEMPASLIYDPPDVVIATYTTLCRRSKTTVSRAITQLVFESLILDEAHTAASPSNLRLIDRLHARSIYALTATKVREDLELEKLEERIGKTLVTIERQQLVQAGYVADVQCLNLVVDYEPSFETLLGKKTALAIHPNKMLVLCSTLSRMCAKRHKILVFCDDIFCLHWSHDIVRRYGLESVGCISMNSPYAEREECIQRFSTATGFALLFISRTGDEALDIPTASAAIVFWNHWGSRRQIVQRIGRIVRLSDGPSPVFVVLLSDDPKEHTVSSHREQYMREHGFCVSTLPQLQSPFGTFLPKKSEAYMALLKKKWAAKG